MRVSLYVSLFQGHPRLIDLHFLFLVLVTLNHPQPCLPTEAPRPRSVSKSKVSILLGQGDTSRSNECQQVAKTPGLQNSFEIFSKWMLIEKIMGQGQMSKEGDDRMISSSTTVSPLSFPQVQILDPCHLFPVHQGQGMDRWPILKFTEVAKVLFIHENISVETHWARRFSSHVSIHLILLPPPPYRNQNSLKNHQATSVHTEFLPFLEKTMNSGSPQRDFFFFFVFAFSQGVESENLWSLPQLENFRHKYRILVGENPDGRNESESLQSNRDCDCHVKLGVIEQADKRSKCNCPAQSSSRSLRVVTFSQPPYVTLDGTGKTVTGGSNHFFLLAIANKLNYSLSIKTMDRKSGGGTGVFKGGKWTGNTGAVHYRQADVVQLVSATVQRSGVIDFCYTQPSSLIFVTGLPPVKVKWQAIFYPYTPLSWLAIFIVFVLCTVVFTLYYFPHSDGPAGHSRILDWASMAYIMLLGQGFNIHIPPAIKFFSTIYMFWVLIINTGYNSDLVSYFSILSPEKIPRDFQQLQQRPDFAIKFNADGGTASQYFADSNGEPAKSIRRRYVEEPRKTECVIASVLEDRTVCITWDTVAKVRVAGNVSLPGVGIPLAVYSKPIVIYSSGFGLQRNSIFTEAVCGMTGRMRDAGLVDKWNDDVYNNFTKAGNSKTDRGNGGCSICKKLEKILKEQTEALRPLKVQNVIAIFVILVVGWLVNSILFGLEIFYFFWSKKKKKSPERRSPVYAADLFPILFVT